MSDSADASNTRGRAPLSALKPLFPYAARYRGRIAAAVVALIVASAATLTLPVAVRRVIDRGFGGEGGLIDAYFGALIGVALILALASAGRFYLVREPSRRLTTTSASSVSRRAAG